MTCKKLLPVFMAITCIFYTCFVTAQMPNYMPAVNNQMMNMQFNNFMLRPMNFGYRNTKVQKHQFRVVMKDSNIIIITGKINSDSAMQYLQWKDNTVSRKDTGHLKKIYPSQTLSITRNDKGSPEFTGIPTDTCWLFKAITGTISGYSPIADEDLTKSFIRYLQKDNGPILEMNAGNLEAMLKDNEKALDLLKRKKYDKAIAKYNKESD